MKKLRTVLFLVLALTVAMSVISYASGDFGNILMRDGPPADPHGGGSGRP